MSATRLEADARTAGIEGQGKRLHSTAVVVGNRPGNSNGR